MTPKLKTKSRRLLDIEQQLRRLSARFDEAVACKVQNALLMGTTRRLLAENDALRRNTDALQRQLEGAREELARAGYRPQFVMPVTK